MNKLYLKTLTIVIAFALYSGCNNTNEKTETDKKTDEKQETLEQINKDEEKNETANNDQNDLNNKTETQKNTEQSEDELMSANIKNFLTNSYLAKELDVIPPKDRRFQMSMIDLNGDGKDEYLVRLMGNYFCGSGGCTFLLLDRYSEIITKFTVTDAPIYVSPEKVNGWNVLYLGSGGSLRKITFEDKTYSPNPSMQPEVDYKPTANDVILFDDVKNPAESFNF